MAPNASVLSDWYQHDFRSATETQLEGMAKGEEMQMRLILPHGKSLAFLRWLPYA